MHVAMIYALCNNGNMSNEKIYDILRYKHWKQVIALWPTAREFASDLNVQYSTVCSWKMRNRIPPEYWLEILAAARLRKYKVGPTDLIGLAALYERKTINHKERHKK